MPAKPFGYREALILAAVGLAAMAASAFAALFALDHLPIWFGVKPTETQRNIVLLIAILWPYLAIAGRITRRAKGARKNEKADAGI